ncbi:DUF5659 domain-containing protein [Caldicoprobacter faecalis]|uniref:DUF5659 domain-containing protein n=1 Tax=Caldicoprobacter faecalis TaxID=937334 RepID=A0A1I5WUP4_9FIRM|nr:DUF5659 domain-containing protein [Caldicoprobacter faecalis]SFQ23331.1 hypothetical protein SAMN05444406_11938 [Caldicoprobacter faecalis]
MRQPHQNGYYVIKSMSLACFLIRKGFNLLKVDDSIQDPRKKVFLFEDTPELQRAITEFTQNLKRKRGY